MNTTLLQLSEENSTDNNSVNKINGEWSNSMTDTNITLEDGDMLSIKNAFVDSAPSGNIFLAEDTEATIQFNYYFTNHDDFPSGTTLPAGTINKRTYTVFQTAATEGAISQPDGVQYIACKKSGGGTTTTIASIQFNEYGNNAGNVPYTFAITVKGTDGKFLPCGEGSQTSINAPYYLPQGGVRKNGQLYECGFGLSTIQTTNLYTGGAGVVNYDNIQIERSDGHKLDASEDVIVNKGTFTHDAKLIPIIGEVTMKFNQGYYGPSHLAHIMTDQLNSANPSGNPQGEYAQLKGINSDLYTTILDLMGKVGGIGNFAFSAMDGSNVCNPTANVSDASFPAYDMMIGSNTFTFDYREDLGIPRFAISQNHSPVYQKALTGIKKIEYSRTTIENGNPKTSAFTRLIGASSGVIPIGVSSTGIPDFWELLGFSKNQFNPSPIQKTKSLSISPTLTTDVYMSVFDMDNITDHLTSTYAGLDILVSKDDNDPANYTANNLGGAVSTNYTNNAWAPSLAPNNINVNDYTLNKAERSDLRNVGNLHNNTFIATTNVSPIFANFPIERALEQINPYYLININVMKNQVITSLGENTTTVSHKFADISAVIGTYYNSSSYTLSQPSDSIPYIHKGNPIPLNNIKVRILDKNKNSNKACLNKSHVFLLLEKAEKAEKK